MGASTGTEARLRPPPVEPAVRRHHTRSPMKILIYGLNFAPELTGVGKYTGEMAAWLSNAGHEVRVISAPPYYPAWRVSRNYSRFGYRRETMEGVEIWRSPLYVPKKPGGLNRVFHLLSFAAFSFPLLLMQIRWRPDVVWTPQPTLFCTPGVLLLSAMSSAKTWLHIQDFEVNAGFGLGLIRASFLRSVILKTESFIMRRFDRVSAISDAMAVLAKSKGVEADVELFPNWVDVHAIQPLKKRSKYRDQLGIRDDQIVLLYSGNMGAKQGLSVLSEIATALKSRSDLVFVFCGNGAYRATLEKRCEGLPNVCFLDLQPASALNELLGIADVHLLPQRAGVSDLMLPSKLGGMLASGRPVIAGAPAASSLSRAVESCGLIVKPESVEEFSSAIVELADNPGLRRALGLAGRERAMENLSAEAILRTFERSLIRMSSPEGGRVSKYS